MANMARREAPGVYQIGIYAVTREDKVWNARAIGPGTIGDGFVGSFATLAAAHKALTGEPMQQPRYVVRKGGLYESHYLQPRGLVGPLKTARRFPTQSAAEQAGLAAFGEDFGII